MAANYWVSTQKRCWLFSKETLADTREHLESGEQSLIHQYPLPDRRLLSVYFNLREHAFWAWLDCAHCSWKPC